jgi:spore germination protein KC
MIKKILAILTTIFIFTGCYDKVEIEDRGFVLSIGIDEFDEAHDKGVSSFDNYKSLNRFTVSVAIPHLEGGMQTSDNEDETPQTIKKASSETILGALKIIDSYSSHKTYLDHTKLIVFGDGILKNPKLFKESLDALERNTSFSRKIFILGTSSVASDILAAKPPQEPMVGMFVESYYKNNSSRSGYSFSKTFDSLLQTLIETGNAVIPKISYTNEELKIAGAGVIKNFKLVGWLNDIETNGYLWLNANLKDSLVIVPFAHTKVPLTVTKSKPTIKFEEIDGNLICYAHVKVYGIIEEFLFNNDALESDYNLQLLSNLYAEAIETEITYTWKQFNRRYLVDGFNFKTHLRKHNQGLYLKHKDDWSNSLKNMELIPVVTVKIKGTGTKI